jgi:hypothetical protein
MDPIVKDFTTIALSIVMVGMVAVIVSRNSNTAGVINSGSSAFNTGLATAEGPVTGYSPGAPIYASTLGLGGFGALGSNTEIGSGYNSPGAI